MKNSVSSMRAAALALCAMCLTACLKPVPVDVATAEGELFFVLEKPMEIHAVRVVPYVPGAAQREQKPVWELRHDLTTEVKTRKYPKLSQLRYGQKLDQFPVVVGPSELLRNVEYQVGLDMGGTFASEVFVLTEDNKAVMPRPKFARQKGRTYTVSAGKDGKRALVLDPVKK